MLGLSLDMVGAFFVAVEAIKLENLRALRDHVLKRAHGYTLSPRIVFVGREPSEGEDPEEDRPWERHAGLFTALHYLGGILLLVVLNFIVAGGITRVVVNVGHWILSKRWYVIVLAAVVSIFYVGVLGLWMLGEAIHVVLTSATKSAVRVLDFVDARTPDGTVGILGFLLLFAGFVFQFYGAYLGAAAR